MSSSTVSVETTFDKTIPKKKRGRKNVCPTCNQKIRKIKSASPEGATTLTTSRAPSKYNLFFKKNMLDETVKKMGNGERMKEIGRRWALQKATTKPLQS